MILGALILVSAIALGLLLGGTFNRKPDEPEVVIDEPVEVDIYEQVKQTWQDNKQINSDYVGELIFDSGLINVSFVQAKSCFKEDGSLYKFYTEDGRLVNDAAGYSGNDVYIWTYWKTGEYDYNDHGGSTFMDYRNEINDENLIIYGHHFSVWNDETRSKAFTPLEQLMEQENYAANNKVTMVLGNEIRLYEVAAVYTFDATDDSFFEDCQYWRTAYNYDDYTDTVDNDYYRRYIDKVRSIQLYDTGVKWDTSDKTLTLQTCISGHTGELFEIVVLKQVEVLPY